MCSPRGSRIEQQRFATRRRPADGVEVDLCEGGGEPHGGPREPGQEARQRVDIGVRRGRIR